MLDITFIQTSGLFKKVFLESQDILFGEGDIDNNIYIIISGKIIVGKQLSNGGFKQLATLKENDIFGEGALNNSDPKQVQIMAKSDTVLYKINGNTGIELLLENHPQKGGDFLKYIIDLSNKRLLESNSQITANYEIAHQISQLESISLQSIVKILESITSILKLNVLQYLEKNPVLDNYYTLRYSSENPGKLSDSVYEINSDDDILNSFCDNQYSSRYFKLNIADMDLGYLIFHKQNSFTDNENKIIQSILTSFAGVLRQKMIVDDDKNIAYIKNESY